MSLQSDDLHRRPVGELLRALTDQTTTLVEQEIKLAKAEMSEKAKQAGIGAGMFGGAGLLAVFSFAALTTALIAVLATGMDTWVAALIVALVYAAIAGVLALRGKRQMAEAGPPVPEQAIESSKEDLQWAKTQARSSSR